MEIVLLIIVFGSITGFVADNFAYDYKKEKFNEAFGFYPDAEYQEQSGAVRGKMLTEWVIYRSQHDSTEARKRIWHFIDLAVWGGFKNETKGLRPRI